MTEGLCPLESMTMSKKVLVEENTRIYSLKEARLPLLLGIGWSYCPLFDSGIALMVHQSSPHKADT